MSIRIFPGKFPDRNNLMLRICVLVMIPGVCIRKYRESWFPLISNTLVTHCLIPWYSICVYLGGSFILLRMFHLFLWEYQYIREHSHWMHPLLESIVFPWGVLPQFVTDVLPPFPMDFTQATPIPIPISLFRLVLPWYPACFRTLQAFVEYSRECGDVSGRFTLYDIRKVPPSDMNKIMFRDIRRIPCSWTRVWWSWGWGAYVQDDATHSCFNFRSFHQRQ